MLCNSLKAKLFPSRSSSGKRSRAHLHGRPCAARMVRGPRIETLEDRRLMAVMVENVSDLVNGDVSSIAALVATDGGDGISLREAVVAANNTAGANVINFAPGVQGTVNLTDGQLDVTDELTIHGPGKGKLTVSGGGQSRVFDVLNSSLAVDQLTIAEGFTTSDLTFPSYRSAGGAGIRSTASTVSLEHVVLENNRIVDSVMAAGAALQARGGSSVSLDHVTARNNEATGLFFAIGGAIQSDQASTLTIEHSTFDGNRAVNHPANGVVTPPFTTGGGAIGISGGGQTTISHSRFTHNEVDGVNARGLGGAINNSFNSSLVVDHSSFLENSVAGVTAGGGAIADFDATSSITHSRFIHNTAVSAGEAQGGAIWANEGSTIVLDRSLLLLNQAEGNAASGGGIYSAASDFTLTNSLVVANRATTDGCEAIGGGVYNVGTMFVDRAKIFMNKASTSHDDVFGDLTALEDLLTLA